jgi:hypothetical protein
MVSSEMLSRVALVRTGVSEELSEIHHDGGAGYLRNVGSDKSNTA